jgi:hypothetical protein
MKSLVLMITVLVLAVGTLSAQKLTKEEKKVAKQEKKAAKKQSKKEAEQNYELFKAEGKRMIETKDFVMFLKMMHDDTGTVPVADNSSFIQIYGDTLSIEFSRVMTVSSALDNSKSKYGDKKAVTMKGLIGKTKIEDLGMGKALKVNIVYSRGRTIAIDIRGDIVDAQLRYNSQTITFRGKYMRAKDADILLSKITNND